MRVSFRESKARLFYRKWGKSGRLNEHSSFAVGDPIMPDTFIHLCAALKRLFLIMNFLGPDNSDRYSLLFACPWAPVSTSANLSAMGTT